MTATLLRSWELIDGSREKRQIGGQTRRVTYPPGIYRLERILNPYGYSGTWLVIAGTKHGMAEGAWKQWGPNEICDDPTHPNFGNIIDWGEFLIAIDNT